MRPSLAAGAGYHRLSWPNVSFAANHRWTCQSIIVIAIDLFTSEDRYFLWIAAVPLFTIPTTFGNAHVRCYSREATRQLNALTVPWSHTVSNNCIYIHSYLLRWYKLNCNRFNHCERPIFFFSASATSPGPPATIRPPFLLVVIRWLRNDFSIPHAPENMSHENIH